MARRAWHGMAVAAAMAWASAAPAAPASVQSVQLATDPGATTLVVDLSTEGAFRVFTLGNPDRVVLDLLDTRLGSTAARLPAGAGAVRQVRAADRIDGSVRIVLDLGARAELQPVTRQAGGAGASRLMLPLRTAPASAVPTTASATPAAPASTPPAPAQVAPAAATGGEPEPTPASPGPVPAAIVAQAVVAPTPAAPAPPTPAPASAAPAAAPAPAPRPVAAAPKGRDVIVAVDAGHGGKDPGAHGPRGVLEKDVTLRTARRLAEVINAEPGMRAVLVRDRDEFIPLRGRMERARAAQADLFVSIHADAVHNRSVRGASVYVLNEKGATDEAARRLAARENAADLIGGVSLKSKDPTLASVLMDLSQNASLSSSIDVADHILEELARVGTVRKPRVMQAPFMVLKSPDVPSVLVETAYISNPDEERQLDSQAYRSRLATAIFAGIRDYFYANPPRGTLVAELSRRRLADAGVEHAVRAGETLSGIAVRYDTTVAVLRSANGLRSDQVEVGQVLVIPRAQPG